MLTSTEQTIRHLQDELDQTRWSVIKMMPWEAQMILMSDHSCKTRKETHQWPNTAASKIIELAKILPPNIFDSSDRAYCPLCGGGSSRAYETGFRLPEGLRRHLVGWGDYETCPVFAIAMRLANEDWDKKFHEAEERAKAHMLKRKNTETLYQVGSNQRPKLLDEGLFLTRARTLAELAWAEERLAKLGFLTTTEGRVRSYKDEREQFVVYADPRGYGRISFTVCSKSIAKRGRIQASGWFGLRDNWKNDIRGKYEARLPRPAEPRTFS
jgi:hypothetical protein